jgi:hypothetical protein
MVTTAEKKVKEAESHTETILICHDLLLHEKCAPPYRLQPTATISHSLYFSQ